MADAPNSPNIEIDWSDEPPTIYVNGAQCLHSQREFSVVLTDYAPFPGRGAPPGYQQPKAKVQASVRMTPDVFFQLAAVFASNWNVYVNQFGAEGSPRPKFRIEGAEGMQLEGLDAPQE